MHMTAAVIQTITQFSSCSLILFFLFFGVSSFSCLLVRSEIFITLFLGNLSILFMLSNIASIEKFSVPTRISFD